MADANIIEVVRRLAVVFERQHVRHALIGGLAVGLRSRPRATKDADFILHVPALAFAGLLEELVENGFEMDVLEVIKTWSAERFLTLWCGGTRVDWMQPVIPLYAKVLDTATAKPWLDAELRVATAEGLILTKMVAFRPQDQVDIETLLIANRDEIDVSLIRQEWAPLADTEQARTAWLEAAIARTVPARP